MKRTTKTHLNVLAAVCLALAACGSNDNNAEAPTPLFEPAACAMPLPEGQDPVHVTCGFVAVPENRSRAASRKIKLAVAVLRATGPAPAADPIIHLGPGLGPLLDGLMQVFTADFAAPLQGSRDLVFFDQRGTGRSTPSLACPELLTLNDAYAIDQSLKADTARDVKSLLACHDRLIAEGVDFGSYTTAGIAADARDILRALGYRQWNLYGWSQSARIAQVLMRDSPAGEIRSVVLDSPVPLQRAHIAEYAAHLERSLGLIIADCAADAACNQVFPDLGQTIFDIVPALNASPLTVEPTDPTNAGQPFRVVFSGDLLGGILELGMQDTSFITLVPALSEQLLRGDASLLTALTAQFAGFVRSDGLGVSVVCQDQVPLMTPEVLAQAARGVDPDLARAVQAVFIDLTKGPCPGWSGVTPISGPPRGVVSDIPTLLLAGELDPATPPEYAHELAGTLHRSTVVEFRGHGHGQLYVADAAAGQPTCAMSVTAQHYAQPERPIDASCAAALPPPHFVGTD